MSEKAKGRTERKPEKAATEVGEELDTLNAKLRSRRRGADLIRRRIEADIETKAKRRRSHEVPASAAAGGAISKPPS